MLTEALLLLPQVTQQLEAAKKENVLLAAANARLMRQGNDSGSVANGTATGEESMGDTASGFIGGTEMGVLSAVNHAAGNTTAPPVSLPISPGPLASASGKENKCLYVCYCGWCG